jgi:hypothetical protein
MAPGEIVRWFDSNKSVLNPAFRLFFRSRKGYQAAFI